MTTTATETDLTQFLEGDLSSELLDSVLTASDALYGKWQILSDISESPDAVMAELGVPYMKRALMKNYSPVTRISESSPVSGHPSVRVLTSLPLGIKKEAMVQIDGSEFSTVDPDTGTWTSSASLVNGRLLQRRVNVKTGGVMWDVRAVLDKDPSGKHEGNILVFKWTYKSPKKGKVVSCLRYMKQVKE